MALNEISIKWNGFQVNMLNNLKSLFHDRDYADVTLVSEGESLKAHKIILSACSPLFSNIFNQNSYKNPIIILQGVSLLALRTLLTFIYNGEVNVTQEFLPELLKAAESLKIKGLSVIGENSNDHLAESNLQSKRKFPWNDDVVLHSSKNGKKQGAHDSDFHDLEPLIPKTEPPEVIWAEGSDVIDSSCNVDCDSLGNNESNEIYQDISQDSVNVHSPDLPKHAKKSNTKKKKNKLIAINKFVSLNANVDNEYSDKNDESVGSGKENVVLELGNEDDIAEDSSNSYAPYEPDIKIECKESNFAEYTNPKFPCPFCIRIYHTWGYRRRHIKTRHGADTLICKWCSLTCTSQASWFEHVIHKHDMGRLEARECLVVLMEAHAVLTCHSPPSPSALLANIHVDDIH